MEINFTVSKEDLLNFHMNHATETKLCKHTLNKWNLYCILAFFVVLMLSKDLSNTYILVLNIINAFIVALILFILRKKLFIYSIRKSLSKIYNYGKYNSYFYPTKLIINEYYLNLITDLDEKHYKWKSIQNLNLIDGYIFITTSSHDDILIPISNFKSCEDKQFFIDSIIKGTNLDLKNSYPIDVKYQ